MGTRSSDETALLIDRHENRSRTAGYNSIPGAAGSAGMLTAARMRRRSTIIVDKRLQLTWENIHVYVDSKDKGCCGGGKDKTTPATTHILRGVSGIAKSGTLLAIMGSSGAGKTTLLNTLTQRNCSQFDIEGAVKVNGQPWNRNISSMSAYIQQNDLFVEILTVREHLIFQASLRMDKHITRDNRMELVEEVINEMGLSKCADTRIGTPGRTTGISGGERKRLAFASELLTNPSLMFCDEPTSGLDSSMTHNVVASLKQLAAKGRTVVCTIHQPPSEVFAMFDQILLLAEGRVAYMGPSQNAVAFFHSAGYDCPKNFNPADFYIYTLAIQPGYEEECKAKVKDICDRYQQSDHCTAINNQLHHADGHMGLGLLENRSGGSPYKASWWQQFVALMWRCSVNAIRQPKIFTARLVQALVISLLVGLVYLQTAYDQKGIQDFNGVLFVMIIQNAMPAINAVVQTFPLELDIFKREHRNGMYRTDVYFICKVLAEMPISIILPLIYTSVVYWMVGLYPGWKQYLIAVGVTVLAANVSTAFGYVISASTSSLQTAVTLANLPLVPLILFGGFFINTKSVPVYFIWLEYISWFKYGNEVMAVNQWRDVTNITCSPSDGACAGTGMDVLRSLNYSEDNVIFDIGAMLGLMMGFLLLAFVLLLIRSYKSKS
ncbi:ABCG1 [Branchiostoma lanceolatum]|uniref:ABCG1 protein n=1 Tax=Branchiostoma lanceolatum TaxID=7740 RepID=A0A8J9Z0A0_BRALA|nr:ABCG1 [Branchiostoma lanceolatum]